MKAWSGLSKLTLLFALLTFFSCKKTGIDATVAPPATAVSIADGFNYENSKTINLDVKLLAPDGTALKKIVLNVYDTYSSDGNRLLLTAVSDENGEISQPLSIPAYLQTIVIDPMYVGLVHEMKVNIVSNTASAILGGPNSYGGNIVIEQHLKTIPTIHGATTLGNAFTYNYLGDYDAQGIPKYFSTSETIDSKLLEYINASLPENQPVPTKHPDFLNTNAQTNLDIVEKSDVWVTFVTEGAGYLNSLAYYTYPTSTPPTSTSDIKILNVVFPNASLGGSGGGLKPGDRIKIGTFTPGTSIGFALIANGWNGTSKAVGTGANVFFSDDALNPETDVKLKRHTVLLYDNERGLFLNGFEDLRRDGGSDNDFNDLVFYCKSNPISGISQKMVNPIDKPIDSDGDGVSDVYDKFPKDPTRAYITYFPDEKTYGTLAYEDLWPATGDYDMNDLVVNYRYTLIKNAANKTVEMQANYAVAAIGAANVNGFGVQFPFAPSLVQNVTGDKLTGNVTVKKSANGTEAGQSKTVIIPFDNAFKMVNRTGGFINTISGTPIAASDTLNMVLFFNTPLDAATLGTLPFNPFLIVNGNRGREVHLPGMKPTDLADTKLFNTSSDNTLPAKNKYYKTKDNMPFAISFVEKFENPVEKINIKDAYLKYTSWVTSGGATFADWYSNKSSGYRSDSKIIKK